MDYDTLGTAIGLSTLVGVTTGIVVTKVKLLQQIRVGDHKGYLHIDTVDIEAELAKAQENNTFLATQTTEVEERLKARDTGDLDVAIAWVTMAKKDVVVLERIIGNTLEALGRARKPIDDIRQALGSPKWFENATGQLMDAFDEAVAKAQEFRDKLPALQRTCDDRQAELAGTARS